MDKFNYIFFGKRIRELRKLNGLTQAILADMLNVSKNNYMRMELGLANPRLLHVIILADFYKVSIDELMIETKDRKIIDIGELTDEQKVLIEHSVDLFKLANKCPKR